MTVARCRQVNVETTLYYHVIGRCVRRAFLCGVDNSSGKDYEHRRQWVIERLKLLCAVFAVDLCSYAIMSNHYHLVVRLAPGRAESWTDEDVLGRWEKLYGIATPIAIGIAETADPAQRALAEEMIGVRRERLSNLSWFMKCLNEHIARRANLEDKCTGSFWEGRFVSQALLDEKALLSCMAYVDLNPIYGLCRSQSNPRRNGQVPSDIRLHGGTSQNQ
jgi:REP element-mobilizing transposase RayT